MKIVDAEQVRNLIKTYGPQRVENKSLKRAAVLVPFVIKHGELHLVYTRRTEEVEHHPGQVSFPGGMKDREDPDLLSTALRETWEEIGVDPEAVTVWGELDHIVTVTRFVVSPYVGLLDWPDEFALNPAEVARVIEVPLEHILHGDHFRERMIDWDGVALTSPAFKWDGELVWGATARISKNLIEVLKSPGVAPR
ncbi:MAG: CoA pyrophosphatase [Proteobacteria bacterium]|nr:CoA pyrophosphatase [Pseudomonadota bacterium]